MGCPTSSLHDLITDIADRESALLVPGSWWSPLQAPGVRSSQVHQHGLAVRRANSGCADKAASKRGLPPSCTARDQLPDPAEGVGRASHELWHTHIVAGWCIRLRCLSMALPIVSTPSRPPICGKAPLPESLYPPQRPILLPWTPVPVQKKTPPKDDLQKITMPYQQRQPTSSSPLLTTHSTTASSAMSTHTKGDPRTHHLCTKSQPIPVPSHHADFHPAHIYLHGSTYRDTALCVVEKRHRPPPPHVITIPPPIFPWDILNPNACFPRDMVRPSKLPDKGRHPSAQQLEFIKGRAFLRRRMVANRALPRRRRGIFRRISTLAD